MGGFFGFISPLNFSFFWLFTCFWKYVKKIEGKNADFKRILNFFCFLVYFSSFPFVGDAGDWSGFSLCEWGFSPVCILLCILQFSPVCILRTVVYTKYQTPLCILKFFQCFLATREGGWSFCWVYFSICWCIFQCFHFVVYFSMFFWRRGRSGLSSLCFTLYSSIFTLYS